MQWDKHIEGAVRSGCCGTPAVMFRRYGAIACPCVCMEWGDLGKAHTVCVCLAFCSAVGMRCRVPMGLWTWCGGDGGVVACPDDLGRYSHVCLRSW